ncbi:MAG: hypothetical protein HYZ53_18945 [Planctomycetes bacterium]|nr:hypothetical protein [Planctomycetota bacterium]
MRRSATPCTLVTLTLLPVLLLVLSVLEVPRRARADDALGQEFRDRRTAVALCPPAGWSRTDPSEKEPQVRATFQDPTDPATSFVLEDLPQFAPCDLQGARAALKEPADKQPPGPPLAEGQIQLAGCPAWRVVVEGTPTDPAAVSYQALVLRNDRALFKLSLATPRDKAATNFPLFEKVLGSLRVNVQTLDVREWEACRRYRAVAARTSGVHNRLRARESSCGIFLGEEKIGFHSWKCSPTKLGERDAYLFEGQHRVKEKEVLEERTYKVVLSVDLEHQTFEQKEKRTSAVGEAVVETTGSIKDGRMQRRSRAGGREYSAELPAPPGALFDALDAAAVTLPGTSWEEPLAVPELSTNGSFRLLKLSKGPAQGDGRHTLDLERDGVKSSYLLDEGDNFFLEKRAVEGGTLELRALTKADAEK